MLNPDMIDLLLSLISRPQADPAQYLAGVAGPMGGPGGVGQGLWGEHAEMLSTPQLLRYEPFNPKFDWDSFIKQIDRESALGMSGKTGAMGRI